MKTKKLSRITFHARKLSCPLLISCLLLSSCKKNADTPTPDLTQAPQKPPPHHRGLPPLPQRTHQNEARLYLETIQISLLQGKSHRYIFAAQRFLPSIKIINPP